MPNSIASLPEKEKDVGTGSEASLMYEDLTAADKRRILRKLDLNVLPILSLLYLCSFLDRGNIGNAKLAGLVTDLKLTSTQYNIAVSIFFATYVSWEMFSNIILKKARPSKYIPVMCFFWGIVTTLTCTVKTFGGLVAVRVFLGITESPLFPGICFIVGLWYPRDATLLRFTIFFSSASLAGAFGGLLARGLETITTSGIAHWRSIYLVEGLLSIGVAGIAYFLLKDDFEVSPFLTDDDKAKLRVWHAHDRPNESTEFDWKEVRAGLSAPLTWVNAFQAAGVGLPIFSYAVFFPSIVAGLGFTDTTAQLMTVPPYAVTVVVSVAIGYFSDRHKKRGVYLIGVCLIGIVGYAIQLGTEKNGARYFGVFLITISVFTANALASTWYGNNLRGHHRRATATGFSIAFGNLAAIGGSYIYPIYDKPRYIMGHAIALGFLGLAIVTSAFQIWYFGRKNKELDRLAAEAEARGESFDHFRYLI